MGNIVANKNGVLYLLLHLLLLCFLVVGEFDLSGLNYTKFIRQASRLRLERIQKHLEKINKPPLITIQSPDGDIIDCVHKRKQPALDHPLLKNHKIQKVPPEMPKRLIQEEVRNSMSNEATIKGTPRQWQWQMWHSNGTRCPKGTVPIRRSSVHDVLRAKSLFHFGKKQPGFINPARRRADAPDIVSGNGHEHAIAYTGTTQEFYGARATINVWDPSIEEVNEFSLSQIWILSGSFDGSDLNSIEAGWQTGQSGALW
ncbi:hypothetical protein E1A91_A11G269300v1 [Gossypium mustelinum]|uniref:Neprosin PEP catalytic domain-containing protein n=1 Tax=Gossypium mustelinum TaxID=34275 RepID=A0A5D2XC75_GOSMU|nr:hypothetical protein E1A91_A11G269300v1 [Gossypium mustelinum]TYJ11331.1 hypothetical protein E1A91_A11G269300v1 [Gossypium mustelinum]